MPNVVEYVEKKELQDTKSYYTMKQRLNMAFIDLEQQFIDYIEHIARGAVGKAELELAKAKECRDVLELPQRKENWSAMETAEEELDDHMKRAFSHLQEVVMLTKGLEVFHHGLIYDKMQDSKLIKKKNIEVE